MIFVTVGSMLPFDRMIRLADEIAGVKTGLEFRAQIGRGRFEPRNMPYKRLLSPPAFHEAVASARLVIAHAGTGSVLTALEAGRPIVIFPRKTSFGEVTTDHQQATARWLSTKTGVFVAMEDAELVNAVDLALAFSADGAPHAPAPATALARKLRDALI